FDLERLAAAAVHESAEAAATDHAMTWDEQRDPIRAARRPDRARCRADATCHLEVTQNAAPRNRPHRFPYPLLVSGALPLEGQVENEARILEVSDELATDLAREAVDGFEGSHFQRQVFNPGQDLATRADTQHGERTFHSRAVASEH